VSAGAAYLLGVGAALGDVNVPAGHLNALLLPQWSRVARQWRARAGLDSDDEVWLHDDVPSLQWAGLAALSDIFSCGCGRPGGRARSPPHP
jgi:hypothetical protein